jgi:hypothetical protein
MKKILIAFALVLVSFGTAQAQYQELVDLKITQVVELQKRVMLAPLPETEKMAALDSLAVSLVQLTNHRDEASLEKLQELEADINAVHQQLATQILAMKKIKMQGKLNRLAAVISEQEALGKDVTPLQDLWDQMNDTLQNL